MDIIISIVIGYLLGCSSMSYYIGKINGFNMQDKGTGNLGASNTMMLMGWKAGILVALHDVLKAIIAVLLVKYLFPINELAPYFAGTACILGHIFPFYLHFKGGKGLASFIGVSIALDLKFAVLLVLVSVILVLITDYIVTATFTVLIAVPLYFSVFTSLLGGLILSVPSFVMIFKHIENIKRIFNGTEVGLRSANRGEQRLNKEK